MCARTPKDRRHAFNEWRNGIEAFWRSPEGQQITAAEQAADAELQTWLAEQTGVIVHDHGGLAPEQWRGTVDGHSFYFRERHDEWCIELDLRPSGRFVRTVAAPPTMAPFPPALLGLLEGGPWLMLWVIVVYAVINFVIQSLIQPKFVGDTADISVTLTVLVLVFWGWVLGPLGAFLAIPLTLLVKAVFVDIDPSTRWIDSLIASKPPDGPQDADKEQRVDG